MAYTTLAYYYDRLMGHVDFERWTDYALTRLGFPPDVGSADPQSVPVILDLACGTGNMTFSLLRRGYRVIALDVSEDMLEVASKKTRCLVDGGASVTFVPASMTDFDLGEKVDAVMCLTDSLNYLTADGDLARTFQCVARHLEPGAPFLFDLHTEARYVDYAHSVFAGDEGDVAYVWETDYDEVTGLCAMHVSLFVETTEPNTYRRFDETHVQRAYTDEHVAYALKDAGFAEVHRYGELSDDPPEPYEGRIFYKARRCFNCQNIP